MSSSSIYILLFNILFLSINGCFEFIVSIQIHKVTVYGIVIRITAIAVTTQHNVYKHYM